MLYRIAFNFRLAGLCIAVFAVTGCKKSSPPAGSALPVRNTSTASGTHTGGSGTGTSTTNPGGGGGGTCPVSTSCQYYWLCLDISGTQTSASYTCIPNFYQAHGAAVSSQGNVYFAGGHDEMWRYDGSQPGGFVYDPVSQSRSFFSLSVPRSFLTGAVAGNKILFAGGRSVEQYTGSPTYNTFYKTVDIYDAQTLTSTTAALTEGRAYLCAVSAGNSAYFIGGRTQNGYSAKMDVYNSVTNSWQVVTMPRERGYGGAALINNKIYIAGGKNNSGHIRIIDVYDIASGQWSAIEAPHEHPYASVVALNNKLFITGGDGLNSKAADIYNTESDEWKTVDLSSSRFNITVASVNNKILFVGGAHSVSDVVFLDESGAVDMYDDNTGQWFTGIVSPPVNGVMAASAGNQLVLAGFMSANAMTINNTMVLLSP